MLRTHTSPMQVRAMEAEGPPIFIAVPGKCYRRDTIDATHLPMFHQMEGLAVAEDITLADLQGTLREMLRGLFGEGREARMRPHFFPFTEPSVEFDVSCFRCDATGKLPDGSRCPLCKGIGWIEVGGAGMVDPNVFGFVEDNGYDPERVQGFAFGFGIERMAMLLHGRARPAAVRRERRPRAGAVLMSAKLAKREWKPDEVPVSWLREYCDPGWDPEHLAERLAMTGHRGRAGRQRRRALGRRLRRRAWSRRSSRIRMPTGCGSARSTPATGSARSSAARPTSPPASSCRSRCPAPCCPTARS